MSSPLSVAARPVRPARRPLACMIALAMTMVTAATAVTSNAALAADTAPAVHRVAAGPLAAALSQFAASADVTLSFDAAQLAGLETAGLDGLDARLGAAEGFARLLSGSGFEAVQTAPGRFTLRQLPRAQGAAIELSQVTVTAQHAREARTEGSGSYTTESMSTATKLPLSLRETPQSVSVLTRQRMDDEGLVTLSDAIRATPGLVVNKSGPERESYYARGFNIDSITYDGLPTSLDTSWYGSDVLLSDLAIYDRVEVVRGAAGLASGAGNPSAAINLVRKRPTRETQLSLSASAGSWDRYGFQADAGGALNAAGTLRARAVASWQDNDSFQDVVSSQRKILYAIAEADLGERTQVTVGASRQENDNTNSWGGLPAAADGGDLKLPRSTFLGNDWDRWDKRSTSLFAELEHRFDNGWKAKLAANRVRADFAYLGTIVYLTNAASGEYSQRAGDYRYEDIQRSYDLNASGPFQLAGREHELMFGASRRSGAFDGYGGGGALYTGMDLYRWDHSVVPEPSFNLSSWFMRSQDRQRSVYAATRLNLADPLKLIVGARLDWYDFQGASPWSTEDYKVSHNLTKYAGLIYDLDERHSVYASYTDIFKPQNSYDVSGSLLDPIVGKNYELGVKGEYFDGAFNASAAVFRIDQEKLAMLLDDQSVCPSYPGLSCYRAAGLVRSQGVDVEIQGALTPDWQLGAGYTYVDKKIEKDAAPEREGTRASTNLPRQQFKLSTLYQLPGQWAGGRWRLGGNLSWQSEIYNASAGYRASQGAHAVVGLLAGYRTGKHLDVQLNINNVFDKVYYQSVSSGAYSPGHNYGAPRNVMLTAKYLF